MIGQQVKSSVHKGKIRSLYKVYRKSENSLPKNSACVCGTTEV